MASTLVSDLFDNIQDRIPPENMEKIFSALNQAIGILSNRLYVLDSDLIIGDLSVSIFASIDYASDTIAFVDGGIDAVDTITDSDSAFVTEGFEADMPIETDCTGNAGPFRITTVAAGTLTLHAEEAVTTTAAGTEYTITSVEDFGYLPSDFNGLVEKPYIDGYTWELEPLKSQITKLAYTSAGIPKWYKVRGNRLYVYPGTDTDITLEGEYYKLPTTITKMNQYVPFYGVMDRAIEEYLIRALSLSPATTDDLEAFLFRQIDLFASKRPKKTHVSMPGGVDYGF